MQNVLREVALDTEEGLTAMRLALAFKLEDMIRGKEDVISYQDTEIPGPEGPMMATVLRPKKRREGNGSPIGILHFHGGGHCAGNRFMGISAVLGLIEELGAVCVTAEYRLTPEHPQPAQVEDSYAALKWMSEHATGLGFDPHKLIVFGGSAGGNLAAGVSLLARDRGGPQINGQVLLYPWLDDSLETRSMEQFGNVPPWTKANTIDACNYALGPDRRYATIYSVPSRAKEDDLLGLPPTYLHVGEGDLLRDECIDFASGLWKSGVSCELHVWPRCWHGFDVFVPSAPISLQASATKLKWVRQLFNQSS